METFPLTLAPSEDTLRLIGQATTGGLSVAGTTQTSTTDGGGLWGVAFDEVTLSSKAKILAWRAWEAILEGGGSKFIMPFCEKRFRPVQPTAGTFSNGALFSNGAGFAHVPTAYVTAAAALRATTLFVTMPEGAADVQSGHHLTIVHAGVGPRLYRVKHARGDGKFEIRPPLREAIAALTPVDFANPRTVMKLIDPEKFAPSLRLQRFGRAAPIFVEAF